MKPRLFAPGATSFSTRGLGTLSSAISCKVTEALNGEYELALEYPISGIHYDDLDMRSIIYAKPNPYSAAQPFRVYRPKRQMTGRASIAARHLAYDLAGIPVLPFTAATAPEAMSKLKSRAAVACPFTFWTDKSTAAALTVPAPISIWALRGGRQRSILDVYGGEYAYDGYTVRLCNHRGADRGVTIKYGKNLLTLEQEANCADVYTGVLPYWYSEEDGEVRGDIQAAPGTYDYVRILPLDVSDKFESKPSKAQVNAAGLTYAKANSVGVPKVSLKVSFAQLRTSAAYQDYAALEQVELGDTVTVSFPRLGVNATARVVRVTYDVLLDRYESIELGDPRVNIAQTMAAQQSEIRQRPTTTAMQNAVANATQQITGAKGGNMRSIYDANGNWTELVVMDTESILTARKLWRFNIGGFGYSKNGYDGPYGTAITMDGAIVANFITTGTLDAALAEIVHLNASNITTGTLAAARIAAHSLNVNKITGSLTGGLNSSWGIDFEAGTLTIGNLSAANITAGTLSADRIAANSIAVSKLTGSIDNGNWKIDLDNGTFTIGNISADNITTGTLAAARIAAHSLNVNKITGSLTGGLSKSWGIDFEAGTLTIGNLSAANITAGTLSADRIAVNSIAVSKLTGSIDNGNWKIDLDNGTFTIGSISADSITSGTLNATTINVTNLNASNISKGTLPVERLGDKSIPGSKVEDLAIDSSKIAGGAIVAEKIDSGAVTAAKIGSGAVTAVKIGSGAVTNEKIGASAVTSGKINSGAVTESKIAELAVTNSRLATSSVSYGKTSFTGTLDQVGVNKSNIEAIQGYFTGSATFSALSATQIYLQGMRQLIQTLTINGLQYKVVGWEDPNV